MKIVLVIYIVVRHFLVSFSPQYRFVPRFQVLAVTLGYYKLKVESYFASHVLSLTFYRTLREPAIPFPCKKITFDAYNKLLTVLSNRSLQPSCTRVYEYSSDYLCLLHHSLLPILCNWQIQLRLLAYISYNIQITNYFFRGLSIISLTRSQMRFVVTYNNAFCRISSQTFPSCFAVYPIHYVSAEISKQLSYKKALSLNFNTYDSKLRQVYYVFIFF